MRGKPVLAFGYAWYRACEGAFYTPTAAACRVALDAVAGGYRPSPESVRLFFAVVEELSIEADIGIGERGHAISREENLARVVAGLKRRLAPEAPRHARSAVASIGA